MLDVTTVVPSRRPNAVDTPSTTATEAARAATLVGVIATLAVPTLVTLTVPVNRFSLQILFFFLVFVIIFYIFSICNMLCFNKKCLFFSSYNKTAKILV